MDKDKRETLLKAIDYQLRRQGSRLPKIFKKVKCDYCNEEAYGTIKLPNKLRQCRRCQI